LRPTGFFAGDGFTRGVDFGRFDISANAAPRWGRPCWKPEDTPHRKRPQRIIEYFRYLARKGCRNAW
jgi:hypothetical protein